MEKLKDCVTEFFYGFAYTKAKVKIFQKIKAEDSYRRYSYLDINICIDYEF